MSEMKEGSGGSEASMHPAALHHEHSKAHMVGKMFASSHGRSHEGCTGGATEGDSTPASVNAPKAAGEMGNF